MGAAASAKLLAAGAAWRALGMRSAGRSLIRALVSGTEGEVTLAGMLLVQAGDRSVALIAKVISTGPASPPLVDVLASIGTEPARAALERATHAPAADVADAAAEALRALDEIDRFSS